MRIRRPDGQYNRRTSPHGTFAMARNEEITFTHVWSPEREVSVERVIRIAYGKAGSCHLRACFRVITRGHQRQPQEATEQKGFTVHPCLVLIKSFFIFLCFAPNTSQSLGAMTLSVFMPLYRNFDTRAQHLAIGNDLFFFLYCV